jgi:anti-sigma B factor antagonist
MPTTTLPRILLESVDGVTVVTFAEKSLLSGQTLQDVAAEMKLIDGLLSSKVLINFDGVEFLSSALLGELYWLRQRIDGAGGQTKLCCIRPDLIEVFRASGFDRKFEIFDTESRALDSF